MKLTGHEIGVLKGYMRDLIEQAGQERQLKTLKGYSDQPYNDDDAMMDLLAILDDRVESEGIEMGLSREFPSFMWRICHLARAQVRHAVWIDSRLETGSWSKTEIRQAAYRALLEYIESDLERSG